MLRAAWERLQAKGPEYIEQLRREVEGQSIPNLPERFRRGPHLEPSSSSAAASSSTVPAPKARPSSEEGVRIAGHSSVRITRPNPLLRPPRPPPQPVPNRVQYRDPSQSEINWLQLQVIEGQSSLTNSQAVISWDHHLFWIHSEFHLETLWGHLKANIQGQSKTCLQLCTVCIATLHKLFVRNVTGTILSRTSSSVPQIKRNLPRSSSPVSQQANS